MESLFIATWNSQMKSRGNLAGINIGRTRDVNKESRRGVTFLFPRRRRSAVRSFLAALRFLAEHRGQLISAREPLFFFISSSRCNNAAPCAHTARRCQWRWLFANSPADLRKIEPGRADATEPHLRIPAEYHHRPREQRETGDSYEGCLVRGGYRGGESAAGGEEGKRRRGSEVERSSTEGYERGCIASGVSSCPVSYVLHPGPYLFHAASLHPRSRHIPLGSRLPRSSQNSSK